VSERRPDVEMSVVVRADELRFDCKPKVDVVPYSNAPAEVEYVSERENLPDEVQEGETYRDVGVVWRVMVTLRDEGDSAS
jgi:hypothetical protein